MTRVITANITRSGLVDELLDNVHFTASHFPLTPQPCRMIAVCVLLSVSDKNKNLMFRSEEMLDFHVQIPFAMNGKQKDSCIEVGNSYDNVF